MEIFLMIFDKELCNMTLVLRKKKVHFKVFSLLNEISYLTLVNFISSYLNFIETVKNVIKPEFVFFLRLVSLGCKLWQFSKKKLFQCFCIDMFKMFCFVLVSWLLNLTGIFFVRLNKTEFYLIIYIAVISTGRASLFWVACMLNILIFFFLLQKTVTFMFGGSTFRRSVSWPG